MIVCIEGADGVGKTTVAESLGMQVIVFPNYETPTGKLIKAVLSGHLDMDPLVFQCLQTVNKLETRVHDDVVLCRYWPSAWVYGAFDGLDKDWLERVHTGMYADQYILLDASAETCLERQQVRGGPPEVYEGSLEKTRRIVKLYRELWAKRRWRVVNAEQPLANVITECQWLSGV